MLLVGLDCIVEGVDSIGIGCLQMQEGLLKM